MLPILESSPCESQSRSVLAMSTRCPQTLLTIDKWSNNQWKRNAFIMRLPALCSALRGLGLLGDAACPAEKVRAIGCPAHAARVKVKT